MPALIYNTYMLSLNQDPDQMINKTTVAKNLKLCLISAWLLVVIAFSILALTKPISQDEGVFLTIGKSLDQGRLPYQDFFDHKPPAIYFLFALVFKFFGANLLAVKIGLILGAIAASVLVKRIGDRLQAGTGWYAAIVFLFLMTQFEGNFLIAELFLLVPLLLSLWLLLRPERNRWWLFIAGLSLGLVPLFKQTALISTIPLVILVYTTAKRGVAVFVAGFCLPWILLGWYLVAKGLGGEAWHQIVTLTLTGYPNEPLSFVLKSLRQNLFWTLPIWALLLLGLKTQLQNKRVIWALILLPLPFMFFRHYPHYWVQILPFVALIAAAVLVNLRSRSLTVATMIFCLAIAGGKVGQDAGPNFHRLREQLRVARILSQARARVVLTENQFTGFYFLLPQAPLNKYLYITEITNAKGAEQKTIDDLRRGPAVLILWPVDPNFAYAKKLQNYILMHSTTTRTFPDLGMRVTTYRPTTSQ